MERLKKTFFAVVLFLLIASLVEGCRCKKASSKPGNVIVNSIGMKLAYIPAGEFEMGSGLDEKGRQEDEYLHTVKLTRAFRIGVTEVTQGQWTAVMGFNRSHFKGDELPIEKISWRDAAAFCKKLSEKEGRVYRLPTEAEWEYACRAGTTGKFSGSGDIEEMGWYLENSDEQTHAVGGRSANAWGLYDMHGNVSEWCSDYYSADYPEGGAIDPTGAAEGSYRIIRGGSWSHFARSARCAARNSAPASYQLKQTGFRVVMEVTE